MPWRNQYVLPQVRRVLGLIVVQVNEFKETFKTEMAHSVVTLKNFEEVIGKQDDAIAVNAANTALAHERVDRRTKRIEELEDGNKELKDRVKTLERQVGEVPGGLLVTC